jgi:hypothetical protein
MIDVVDLSLTIIQKIIEIRYQIQYNKQQCYRLIDRLSTVVPMLQDWKKKQSDLLPSSYHGKTLNKFFQFLKETEAFIFKFTDRNYLNKVFQRNIDTEMFIEMNNDLSHYLRELQLGVLFDVRQCQEEDQADRQQDMSDLRREMTMMSHNNQAMMDVMLANMQQMMSQVMNRVDQVISSSNSTAPTTTATTASSSSLSTSLDDMTDHELESIGNKIEAIGLVDDTVIKSQKTTTASTATSSKKSDITLDDLQTIDHKDIFYSTDNTSGSYIGGGSFGDVYRGTFKRKPVAIKVLKDNTAMAMNALKKEAYAMQLLSSCKYMIGFYGVHIDNKPYYLVMELAACSLYDMLYDDHCLHKLPQESLENHTLVLMKKLKVLYEIIQGISFLHTVKVIHRDIKPMNVMLSTGSDPIMKLSDFGSAKMKDIGASTNGLAKGTPAYMAPEIILAEDPDKIEYTEASDIYAFGILMNEVLDHSKPFEGLKGIQIIRALDKGSRPKLYRSDEDLTATGDGFVFELQLLIDRCWHENVNKRPAASSIAKKLSRLGGFKSLPAVMPTPVATASINNAGSPPASSKAPDTASASTTSPVPPVNAQTPSATPTSPPLVSEKVDAKSDIVPPKPPKPNRNSVTAPLVPIVSSSSSSRSAAPIIVGTVITSFPPPPPVKPLQPAVLAPTSPQAAPTPIDFKTKEITDLLGCYDEAYQFFVDVRMLFNFEKVPTMKHLALTKVSKQSTFMAGFSLACLSVMEAKAIFALSAEETLSLGRFVYDEMQLIFSTPHLKQHPKLVNYANYFLALVLEFGYHSKDEHGKNLPKAFQHMKSAADGGFPPAECSLGLMYDRGIGVAVNQSEGFKWFRRSADANYLPALHNTAHSLQVGDGCTLNLVESARFYQRAVDGGYVSSMVNLAILCRDGHGVPKNVNKAFQLFQQGAVKGCPVAQMHLGRCYENGIGVAINPSEAVNWYQQSANRGDSTSKYLLGICYDFGIGVTKDSKRAKELYQASANAGHRDAKFVIQEVIHFEKAFRLFHRIRYQYEFNDYSVLTSLPHSEGNLYASGFHLSLHVSTDKGVKNHLALTTHVEMEAMVKDILPHLQERAAFEHRGVRSYALYFLGVINENGPWADVPRNPAKAFNEYYLVAAQLGLSIAQNTIGYCYCTGSGCNMSDREALPWFQRAAQQGFSQALHNLAYSYRNGLGIEENYASAIECYLLAADQGHVGSMLNLGVMYEDGHGVVQDFAQAVKFYRTAADKGESQAQYNLAHCYEKGIGVPKDKHQAKHYYQLAAAQQHAEAKAKLEKCVIS